MSIWFNIILKNNTFLKTSNEIVERICTVKLWLVYQVLIYINWDKTNVLIWHVYFIQAGLIIELWKLSTIWFTLFTLCFLKFDTVLHLNKSSIEILSFKIFWHLESMIHKKIYDCCVGAFCFLGFCFLKYQQWCK